MLSLADSDLVNFPTGKVMCFEFIVDLEVTQHSFQLTYTIVVSIDLFINL